MSPLFTKPKHYQNQDKFIEGLTYSDIVRSDSNFPIGEISKAHVSNSPNSKISSYQKSNLKKGKWLKENFPQGGGRNFKVPNGNLATTFKALNRYLPIGSTVLK